MTFAPAAKANFNVGNAARIRASLVTFPSFTGTLRSSRINTRLFAKSTSFILITVMHAFLIVFIEFYTANSRSIT